MKDALPFLAVLFRTSQGFWDRAPKDQTYIFYLKSVSGAQDPMAGGVAALHESAPVMHALTECWVTSARTPRHGGRCSVWNH